MKDTAGRRTHWWIGLVLLILAIAPFLQVRGFDFVNFDDNFYITDNQIVQSGLTWEGVKHAFTTIKGGNWHPLTWMSHMLDCSVFRQPDGSQWPGGHHLVSVVIHAINSLLLWLVFRSMTGAVWRSVLVAAWFAVHPLHVESVAWVAERKDVLSTLFGLLAMWFYADYARRGGALLYLAMLGLLVLSLLAKPMFVTMPFLLLLLDLWPLRRANIAGIGSDLGAPATMIKSRNTPPARSTSVSRLVIEKIPLLAIAMAFSVTAVIAQKSAKAMSSLDMISLPDRAMNAIVAYTEYLWKLFVPTDLAVFYPHPGHWPTAHVVTSSVILLAITAMAVAQRQQRPWMLIGWLWFVGMLVPVIGLVQVGLQSIADRYTYVPAVGVLIMVGWSLPAVAEVGVRRLVAALASLSVLVLTGVTHAQVKHWRDSRALFTQAQSATRNNFMAHQNLGNALERAGDLDAALAQYLRAMEIRGSDGKIHENVANVLIQKNRLDEALEQIQLAITLDPESDSAFNSLGIILMARQKFAEAEQALRHSVELDPDNVEARINYGIVLLRTGKFPQAVDELAKVTKSAPQRYFVRTNLALALAGSGRRDEALAELNSILAAKPDFAPAQAAKAQIQSSPATQPMSPTASPP